MKKITLIALLCLCFAAYALAEYPAFDLENVTVTLNNGVKMPIIDDQYLVKLIASIDSLGFFDRL